MALQKHHHVLHAALLLPRLHDAPGAHFADAVDFENPQRLFGEHSQSFQTESRHQSLRVSRTDSLDHARAEIFFDAFEGGGIDLLPVVDLKLQAVARMALPRTRDFDLFAFGNRKNRADDRNRGATVFIQARHGVMRFGVLVGDPADGALNRRRFVLLVPPRYAPRMPSYAKAPKSVNAAPCLFPGGELKSPPTRQCPHPLPSAGRLSSTFFDNSTQHARLSSPSDADR